MRWRQRYMSRSKLMTVLRLALGGITATAPRSSSSALSQSASNALSPSRAPKATPSISGRTPTVSWCWPGSRTKRAKLPRASTRATILVVRPPRERPMAWFRVPLCAARLLVGGDNGAIDQGVFEVRLIGQALEDAREDAARHPAPKALEDAIPLAETARQVAPGHARSHAPKHRLQEQPIVPGRRPRIGGLAGQQRGDLLPGRVAHHKPRPLKHCSNPAKAALEARPVSPGNPQCQQALTCVGPPSPALPYAWREAWSGTACLWNVASFPPVRTGTAGIWRSFPSRAACLSNTSRTGLPAGG